ncbi:MAG: hypothetical protein SH847_07045 [Roseiflexaceae bacterium]|nr:hypothetical protein [Roseiflexaceae bacterium]
MSPAPLLLLLIATASAALAHVLWGRHWLQLGVFWLAACAGCLIAYAIGVRLPLPFPMVVPAGVPVVEAILGAWGLMFIASRLRV